MWCDIWQSIQKLNDEYQSNKEIKTWYNFKYQGIKMSKIKHEIKYKKSNYKNKQTKNKPKKKKLHNFLIHSIAWQQQE